MRDGWYMKRGRRVEQRMVFPNDHPVYAGQPKGLRQVVMERFGGEAVKGKRQEDLVRMLEGCEDFQAQTTLLEEQALQRGDRVIFGVKFHPELAPIEAAYRSIAKSLRISNTTGSSAGFKERVEAANDTADLTLTRIRKYFRSSREYLRHYVEGKSMAEIESLRKERRKHRGASPSVPQGPDDRPKSSYKRDRLK
ncbi:hypothetical protein FOZ62_013520 [Perkinsus olseni]|nr:hypothetical protein FOZ62_013520 [Perkinsus olseni]